MEKNLVTIIIPAYNEEKAIYDVVKGVRNLYPYYEIIVIDDGSLDSTGKFAEEGGARVITHPINHGYGASLKTGIKNAKGDIVVFFDADGQHDPKDIERLVLEIGNNDMVVGSRGNDSYNSWLRRPGKWVLKVVANFLAKQKIPDLNSGLRAVKKSVIKKYLHLMPIGFSFSTTSTIALLKQNYSVKYIPIKVVKRKGKSTVKPVKNGFETIILILRLITLFDPLRIYLPASLICLFVGIAYQIIIILLHGFHVEGGSIVSILVGVLIFFFGLVADQVSSLRLEKYE